MLHFLEREDSKQIIWNSAQICHPPPFTKSFNQLFGLYFGLESSGTFSCSDCSILASESFQLAPLSL